MARHTAQELVAAAEGLERLADELESLDRAPFRRMLGEFLGVKPTKAALRKWANKNPGRWAEALSTLGSLAGYDKGSIQLNVYNVRGMSDAQLLAEARRAGITIDVTPGEQLALPEPAEKTGRDPSSPEGSDVQHMQQNSVVAEDGRDGP